MPISLSLMFVLCLSQPAYADPEQEIQAARTTLTRSKSTPEQVRRAIETLEINNAFDRLDVQDALVEAIPFHLESILHGQIGEILDERIPIHPKKAKFIDILYHFANSAFDDNSKAEALRVLSSTDPGSNRLKEILLLSLDPKTNGKYTRQSATTCLHPFSDEPHVRTKVVRALQEGALSAKTNIPTRHDRYDQLLNAGPTSSFLELYFDMDDLLSRTYQDQNGLLLPKSFPKVAEFLLGRKLSSAEKELLRAIGRNNAVLTNTASFTKSERRILLESGLFLGYPAGNCLQQLVRSLAGPQRTRPKP